MAIPQLSVESVPAFKYFHGKKLCTLWKIEKISYTAALWVVSLIFSLSVPWTDFSLSSVHCHIKQFFLRFSQIFSCLNRSLSLSLYIVSFGPLSPWKSPLAMLQCVHVIVVVTEIICTPDVVLQLPESERGKALSLTWWLHSAEMPHWLVFNLLLTESPQVDMFVYLVVGGWGRAGRGCFLFVWGFWFCLFCFSFSKAALKTPVCAAGVMSSVLFFVLAAKYHILLMLIAFY